MAVYFLYQISIDSGMYWTCVESEYMFMGFRNVVSGTFLRRTSKNKIAADYKTHTENEKFCVRHIHTLAI